MTISASHRLAIRTSDILAMLLIALGSIVIVGWVLDRPITVRAGVEHLGMTLNSAVSLILAGSALAFGRPRVRLTLAILLAIPSTLTLCEHAFGIDLFIDQLFGVSWTLEAAPHPGRMAPQIAASFALSALAFAQLARPRSRLDWILPLVAAAVFVVAVVSLLGPFLRLDIIYDWDYDERAAPHTAAGLMLVSVGLAHLIYRRSFSPADDISNDARRILAVSTAAIIAITIACAGLCFAVVVRHSDDIQQASLGRDLRNQMELIGSEIAAQRYEASRLLSSPSLAPVVANHSLRIHGQSPELQASLQAWADRRLPMSKNLSAIELRNSSQQPLLRSGSFVPTTAVVTLDTETRIEIGAEAVLIVERPLAPDLLDESGRMKMQFTLPHLNAALEPDTNGAFNTAVCHASDTDSMDCLRLSGSPETNLTVSRDAAGRFAALNLAFAGKTGVTLGTGPNGARLLAAYGPLAETPLVMTLTTPLGPLYSELRQKLNMLLALMIGLIAGAAWVLRSQIAPLIAKVVAARSRANESAMHLTAIMDTAGDGIITVNRIGTVLSVNPEFGRLLDSQSEALIGTNLTTLLPGLELRPDEHGVPSLAHCADERAMEYVRTRADGRTLPLQVEFAWLDSTTRGMLVATVRDLTLLKQGETELREIHERLQHSERLYRDQATRLATLFDSVEDAIVIINAEGDIEGWNLGAQHMFGYATEDMIGKDVRLLLPEPHASSSIQDLLQYAQDSGRSQLGGRIEVEVRHGSGRLVPVELSARRMVIEGKQLYGAVMRDISVRREVERMKGEFVSTISHELRTPLTSIAGSLTLISGGAAGEVAPKVARLVGIARQNSERLIRLINDILDLEKAEAGKLEFQFSVRSLRAEVASVAEFNRGFAQSLGVAIELEEGDDADVFIDSDRLTQVLTNLISNAAKFSPPGGMVRIRIGREDPGVRVTVSDDGPGIPAEFCHRIFQKFAQADGSDSRTKGGTGLGLSIAKTITEKLGGRIGFDTAPGKGTSFYVILPLHGRTLDAKGPADVAGKSDETAATESERSDSVPRILHIEDDQSLTAIVHEAMAHNAVVTSARSIAAARQLLQAQRYDAIILDVSLPDGSGTDLLPISSSGKQHPPVIVSYTADEPSRALRAAVDATLIKSRHSVTQLLVTVLSLIDEKSTNGTNRRRRIGSAS